MATTQQQELDHDHEDDIEDTARFMLSPEEGRKLFDEAAFHWMGITGEEFLRRWDAGE